jgi:hypothetical protein
MEGTTDPNFAIKVPQKESLQNGGKLVSTAISL